MLRKLRDYTKDLFSEDVRTGALHGFVHTLRQPIAMVRTFSNDTAYKKLMDNRMDLGRFCKRYYVFPPLEINDREAYSFGYSLGIGFGVAMSLGSLGLFTGLAKWADYITTKGANKFYPRIGADDF